MHMGKCIPGCQCEDSIQLLELEALSCGRSSVHHIGHGQSCSQHCKVSVGSLIRLAFHGRFILSHSGLSLPGRISVVRDPGRLERWLSIQNWRLSVPVLQSIVRWKLPCLSWLLPWLWRGLWRRQWSWSHRGRWISRRPVICRFIIRLRF